MYVGKIHPTTSARNHHVNNNKIKNLTLPIITPHMAHMLYATDARLGRTPTRLKGMMSLGLGLSRSLRFA